MCIDSVGSYFTGGGNGPYYGIRPRNTAALSLEVLLAVMVSRVAEFWVRSASSTFRGGYLSFGKRFIEGIPVPRLTEKQEREIASLAARLVGRRDATATDEWRTLLNRLYARYNLKSDHVALIEAATKGCSQPTF